MERNDYLMAHADFILAVYDGGKRGGTVYTVRRALEQEKCLITIHPDMLQIMATEDPAALNRRSKLRLLKNEKAGSTKET